MLKINYSRIYMFIMYTIYVGKPLLFSSNSMMQHKIYIYLIFFYKIMRRDATYQFDKNYATTLPIHAIILYYAVRNFLYFLY